MGGRQGYRNQAEAHRRRHTQSKRKLKQFQAVVGGAATLRAAHMLAVRGLLSYLELRLIWDVPASTSPRIQ